MSIAKSIFLKSNGVRGLLAVSVHVPQVTSNRNASHDIKYLSDPDMANMGRGRGGRSSFSGTVVTVFGAYGFVGHSLLSVLGSSGHQLILPFRGEAQLMNCLKLNGDLGQILFHQYDVMTDDVIKRAVKYSDVVINLLSSHYETWNSTYHNSNVVIPERIARVCKEQGVKKFMHMSSLNSDRPHEGYMKEGGSVYMKTKGIGEQRVREAFPEAIIFRPSDTYGLGDRFLRYWGSKSRTLYTKQMFVPFAGMGIFKQPVFVDDVTKAINNAISIPEAVGNTYELYGPRRYELADFIDWMFRVTWKDHRKYDSMRWDLKHNPLFQFIWKLNDKKPSQKGTLAVAGHHRIYADMVERECITDITTDLPNLLNLGVKPTNLEDKIQYFLSSERVFHYYKPMLRELDPPKPSPYQQMLPV